PAGGVEADLQRLLGREPVAAGAALHHLPVEGDSLHRAAGGAPLPEIAAPHGRGSGTRVVARRAGGAGAGVTSFPKVLPRDPRRKDGGRGWWHRARACIFWNIRRGPPPGGRVPAVSPAAPRRARRPLPTPTRPGPMILFHARRVLRTGAGTCLLLLASAGLALAQAARSEEHTSEL